MVRDSYENGIRYHELAKELEKKFKKLTPQRAEFIAKQETKVLAVEIKKVRYVKAGFNLYIWRTMRDGRVRQTHKALDGTIQDWRNPPIVNDDGDRLHPSEDVNCRCRALPIIDK